MKQLEITQRREGSVIVLDLKGNIRLGEGNVEFHKALRILVEEGEKRILLNLAEITYIDSSGLGELVAGYTTLQKNNGELKILHLTQRVRELMVITKLLTVFDVYDNEPDALAGFSEVSEEFEPEVVTGKLSKAVLG